MSSKPENLEEMLARIALLESEIAAPIRPSRLARVATTLRRFAIIALPVAAIVAGFLVGWNLRKPPSFVVRPVIQEEDANKVRDGDLVLAARPKEAAGPALVDVDGDGARDLVTLAWRANHPEEALYVVALDRITYAVKWRSGPFVSTYADRLVRLQVEDEVLLVDGREQGHLLELRTGVSRVVGDFKLTDEATEKEKARCPVDHSRQCFAETSDVHKAWIMQMMKGSHVLSDLISDEGFITIVDTTETGKPTVRWAVAWYQKPAAPDLVKWRVQLAPVGEELVDPVGTPNRLTAIAAGRVVHVYQEEASRRYVVAIWDAVTGLLLGKHALPLPDGSLITSLTADRSEAFLVANESIFVIRTTDGAVTKRIQTL